MILVKITKNRMKNINYLIFFKKLNKNIYYKNLRKI